MTSTSAVYDPIVAFFGPDGALAERLPGYEPRPPQVDMAVLVAETIAGQSRAVVEAATGTGKTLAYLYPAIASGKRTLVSTATKNLQEQIFYKDVPFLRELGLDFKAAYLKGRSNYLCLDRFDKFQVKPLFRSKADAAHWSLIRDWAAITEGGDRAELTELPDDYPTWFELSATAETCLGAKCPQFNDCYVTQVRRRAAQANLIIVNHHLLFADLAVRAGGHGEVLPDVDVVIFDEAHHLEDVATSFFGRSVSPFRVRELTGDVSRAIGDLKKPPRAVVDAIDRVTTTYDALSKHISDALGGKDRAQLSLEITASDSIEAALKAALGAIDGLGRQARDTAALGEVAETLSRRCGELSRDLDFVVRQPDSSWVYFTEFRGRRRDALFLNANPVDVGPMFRQWVYPHHKTTVFTSATLTVNGSFDYYRSRIALGVDEVVEERRLDSTFDYMSQALLFVPDALPAPNTPDFVPSVVPTIRELIGITNGRAFVLFTSYRNMRECRDLLGDDLPYPLLVQGDKARSALLDEFKEKPSILLATSSFWEGVDVQGDLLSLVIIDKLPFSSPGDPVVKARIDYVREQGGEPFRNYQLPEAAITLKQGFGRLIRHRSDRGIVAILDRRLLEKSYGRVFINTLPRARRTRDLEVVRRWWEGVSA